MLPDRSRGLFQVHSLAVCLALPLIFSIYTHSYALIFKNFHTESIHFPVYYLASFLSGALSLIYYPKLALSVGHLPWYKAFRMANRQTLLLLIVMFSLIFATKDKAISRVFVVSFIGFSWLALLLLNQALPKVLSRIFFKNESIRNCLLIGNPTLCVDLENWLLAHAKLGLRIVGYVCSDEPCDKPKAIPYLGKAGHLHRILKEHKIHQVILLETQDSKSWVQSVLKICEEQACRILIYNPWRDYFNQPIAALQEGVHTFFTFKEEPLENPINSSLKRLLDILIALPVVLFILPVLAAIVKVFQSLEAPGPLLFKQKRIGLNHKIFIIYKFRSMFKEQNQSHENLQASPEDKRIFEFGKWMRRLSIDEFPQFINVLKGDMSIVGPRPHFIGHDYLFNEYIYQYRQRHFVKPGITGLAQVKGYRGEITDLQLLRERTSYDLFYIDHWSLGLDWMIILKTCIQMVFPPKSAY